MKNITILGATGSIGTQALEVVSAHPEDYQIVALSTHHNIRLLEQQVRQYHPQAVCISDESLVDKFRQITSGNVDILSGSEGLLELAAWESADLVLNALVGAAGMAPTVAAITAGHDVALSNKESLVMAGGLISELLVKHQVSLFPVDSEHSAIWQCLQGEDYRNIERLLLTGSGGPFRTRSLETFAAITPKEALQHPNWTMGSKITIDSATMMNKGLEVIEAHWLFKIIPSKIQIVIHPQSIIHSMVEFCDGSVMAQLGLPDMKLPIHYAMSHPLRIPTNWERLDLVKKGTLTFEPPDTDRFPCIDLAYRALESGGSSPAVLNVANDECVAAFLAGRLAFQRIPELIAAAMDLHDYTEHPDIDDIDLLASWTREYIETQLKG